MQEVEVDGRQYRTGKLDAFKQFHLVRKLMPLFSGLGESFSHMPASTEQADFWKSLAPIAQAVSEMSTEDSEWILKTCLTAVTVNNGRAYVPITTPQGQLMFDDMEMTTMIQLAFTVIQDNLGSFFPGPQPNGLDNATTTSEASPLPQ
jgi:hypothetical protein